MSQPENSNLYFVSKSDLVVVISFQGALNEAALPELQRCQEEIQNVGDARFFILNFSQATTVSSHAAPMLAQLQRSVRSKEMKIRICGLPIEIREKLEALGIVRRSEVGTDLNESLSWVKHSLKVENLKNARLGRKAA